MSEGLGEPTEQASDQIADELPPCKAVPLLDPKIEAA
jgi:hypothetical protein